MKLILAYPPSANHYKGKTSKGREYLKKEAIDFFAVVCKQVADQLPDHNPIGCPVIMSVLAYPPNRRGDCMNREKVLSDSLEVTRRYDKQRAGVYVNDKQVWDFSIKWDYYINKKGKLDYRLDPDKKGYVVVTIEKIIDKGMFEEITGGEKC